MPQLETAVAALPPEKQMTPEQLQDALGALIERGWIKRTEESGDVVYSVQQIH